MVEAAFALPILFVLISALIDIGFWVSENTQVANAARDGTRVAMLQYNNADSASGGCQHVSASPPYCTILSSDSLTANSVDQMIQSAIASHLAGRSFSATIECLHTPQGGSPTVIACSSAIVGADEISIAVTTARPSYAFIGPRFGASSITERSTVVIVGVPTAQSAATTTTSTTSSTTTTTTCAGGTVTHYAVAPSTSTPSAGTAFTVTLTAEDCQNNTVTTFSGSPTITWSGATTSPSGKLPGYPSGIIFTNGVSNAVPMTLYAAGSNAVTATSSSPSASGSTSLTVQASAASNLAWTSASIPNSPAGACYFTCSSGTNGVTFTSKVSLTDAYGNPVANSGIPITVTVTNTGGRFTGSAQVTIATGQSQSSTGGTGSGAISFTSDKGSYRDTLTAADGTHTAANATFSH